MCTSEIRLNGKCPFYKLTQIIHNLFSSWRRDIFISQISYLHKIFLLTAFEQGYLGKVRNATGNT